MKKIIIIAILTFLTTNIFCQVYMSRTAFIGFYSKTPLEDIVAENQQTYAVVDLTKKQLAFAVLLKSFEFKKELMQTHFNENYVESDKYPKASFTGSFSGEISGTSIETLVNGNLTLHGVTKKISVPVTMQLVDGKFIGQTKFMINPEDFNISIPSLVRDKISSQITVEVKVKADQTKN